MDEARRDAFAGRVFEAGLATMDLFSVYLGERLGLYRVLSRTGPLTPAAFATRAGIDARYAREWLEQQAVTGILEVHQDGGEPRFALPEEHAEVLLHRESLNYVTPLARYLVGIGRQLPGIAEAYRSGGGLTWGEYGEDVLTAQADFNRPAFLNLLGQEWLPSLPEIDARLRTPGATVADIACGGGWSSIAMARAYPGVTIDGYDYDAPSIELARQNASDAGVADRVRFHLADASDPTIGRKYDLVTVFEALHDMSRPVEALSTMRGILAPGGSVLVMDERVAPEFGGPASDVERLLYGFSSMLCLVNSMAEQPSAATGTVFREPILRRYASEAGFTSVGVLPIEHDFFRFYLLKG